MPKPKSPFKQVRRAFSRTALKRICEMHETEFGAAFGLDAFEVESRRFGNNFYFFGDNGSDILAVAHLDTVVEHHRRMCGFVNTAAGLVVHSGALDDRLGAYTILECLPSILGFKFDILLTVGEESGQSTAEFFEPSRHHERDYNWIIEFDRGGTDVVLYEYEDDDLVDLVEETGARVGSGSFSDISYMEHLGLKAMNWGVGYRDYHSARGHAYLEDYWMMLGYFLRFHEANKDLHLPHERMVQNLGWTRGKYGGWWWDDSKDYAAQHEKEYREAIAELDARADLPKPLLELEGLTDEELEEIDAAIG